MCLAVNGVLGGDGIAANRSTEVTKLFVDRIIVTRNSLVEGDKRRLYIESPGVALIEVGHVRKPLVEELAPLLR